MDKEQIKQISQQSGIAEGTVETIILKLREHKISEAHLSGFVVARGFFRLSRTLGDGTRSDGIVQRSSTPISGTTLSGIADATSDYSGRTIARAIHNATSAERCRVRKEEREQAFQLMIVGTTSPIAGGVAGAAIASRTNSDVPALSLGGAIIFAAIVLGLGKVLLERE